LSAARGIRRVDRERGHAGSVNETEPFNQYLYEISEGVSALDYSVDLQWFHAEEAQPWAERRPGVYSRK